jgi:hypothetical protein
VPEVREQEERRAVTRSFPQANRFWFDEGRTARALRLYGLAAREQPDDPAVLFQAGLALWGVDRFDEATRLLLRARDQQERLTPRGRTTLEAWLPQFVEDEARRHYPELDPAELDRDRFTDEPPGGDWRLVAECAAERRMFGVADEALRRWGRPPIDGEDARELDEIRTQRGTQLAAIRTLEQSLREARRRPDGR